MYKHLTECQNQLEGIQAIDYFLAREMVEALALHDQQKAIVFHSIMLTSYTLRKGHSCLKIESVSALDSDTLHWHNPDDDKQGYTFPKTSQWLSLLSQLTIHPADKQPLVYENNRLYLRRYWQFEHDLAHQIKALIKQYHEDPNQLEPLNKTQAKHVLAQLFPNADRENKTEIDWQKVAVANALIHPFTIIVGGPGTGKTFTVTKVLATLQALSDKPLMIAMVAPTGKAAQRLNESIQKAKSNLRDDIRINEQVLDSIPDSASTVHRLLGVIPHSHNFRYHEDKHLPYNVLLVDEISMIDLPLMTRLMRAVPNHCRIIMLGDADQLPSVAAGSVLADLAPRQQPAYSQQCAELLNELTDFKLPVLQGDQLNLDYLCVLQKSYRFDGKGEIGQLAKYVIQGEALHSWVYLLKGQQQIRRIGGKTFYQWLETMVKQYYYPLFDPQTSIEQGFKYLSQFRFLAATRLGEQGVLNINHWVEQLLRDKGLITTKSEFYSGKPIMVMENNYNIGLYNGDTGLLWHNTEGKLQAVFQEKETMRWLSLGRLPKVETVYAMTIHKTQGSEFKHVALILPEKDSLVLSRELLYTGMTRASEQLSLFAEKSMFTLAVKRKVQRYSGLKEKVFSEYKHLNK